MSGIGLMLAAAFFRISDDELKDGRWRPEISFRMSSQTMQTNKMNRVHNTYKCRQTW